MGKLSDEFVRKGGTQIHNEVIIYEQPLNIQLGTLVTMAMESSKLEFVNVTTTSISIILGAWKLLFACGAHFLLLYYVVFLPYKSTRDNDLFSSMIRIYSFYCV